MNYHFDEESSPVATFISGKDNTFSCPFSGRYSLTGSRHALADLLHAGAGEDCQRVSFFMQAGCSDSSDLHVESACHPRSQPARYYYPQSYEPQGDAPVSVSKSEFVCHGEWRGGGRNGRGRQLLLSSGPTLRRDNSLSRQFACLSYSESAVDGVLRASISRGSCATGGAITEEAGEAAFNITSSGPCLQALTGRAERTALHSALVTVAALAMMTKALWATMPLSC